MCTSFPAQVSRVRFRNEGLIYRHYRPVHYSPSSRSALAEAELVYNDDHVSHSVYFAFDIDRKSPIKNEIIRNVVSPSTSAQLLVWTTTPWTLTANMVRQPDAFLGFVLLKYGI